jgi:hypothetical protein
VATIVGSDNEFPKLLLVEGAAPATPATGRIKLYAKSDGLLYWKDDAGTEYAAGGDISAHTGDTTDAHDASAISIVDSGAYFTGTEVEAALQELGAAAGGGGGGGDLTIPSGGTLYDGTSTSGFTAIGGIDTFDADTTIPEHFYLLEASSGGNNIYGATHAVGGSFPRTYTARVDDILQVANYQGCGMILGDGTKLVSWGTIFDSNDVYFQRYLWNSVSSAGANANYLNGGSLKQAFSRPIWLRIIVNSTTDLDLQWSRGGYIWQEAATALNPSMTIDRFGLFVYGFGARAEGTVKWIHES